VLHALSCAFMPVLHALSCALMRFHACATCAFRRGHAERIRVQLAAASPWLQANPLEQRVQRKEDDKAGVAIAAERLKTAVMEQRDDSEIFHEYESEY